MSDGVSTGSGSRFEERDILTFRGVQGEKDYPLLFAINHSSRQADKNYDAVSLEDIAHAYTPSDEFNPARDMLIAELVDGSAAIGYSKLGWYSSSQDNRLYYQVSFLKPEFRKDGYWETMVRQNERRLKEIAEEHPPKPQRFFQAWASDHQAAWSSVLENTGYRVVRRFNNMLYRLDDVAHLPIPAGFEIRPVKPEDMCSVWEAQKEMNEGLFENVTEDWLEEKYTTWLENPAHTPQLWQVAWVGNQLAGMVLARIDEDENEQRQQKRGYTEHIYVRQPWRKRGLASALVVRSLQVLKEQGMHAAELGVDSENDSTAFSLYQKLGYKTFSIDTWYRKNIT